MKKERRKEGKKERKKERKRERTKERKIRLLISECFTPVQGSLRLYDFRFFPRTVSLLS